MEIILAILLYLQLIISPGTYHISHIENLQLQHRQQIELVEQDPIQMQIVTDVYLPDVQEKIIIIMPGGDR